MHSFYFDLGAIVRRTGDTTCAGRRSRYNRQSLSRARIVRTQPHDRGHVSKLSQRVQTFITLRTVAQPVRASPTSSVR